MSVDQPRKRKPSSKQAPGLAKTPGAKKRPKSLTADDLEALLNLLDDDETSGTAAAPKRKTREPVPPRKGPTAVGGASSFMQELARARADLHQEHRSREALEEEAESLRRELARLAANDSAKVDELHHQSEVAALTERIASAEVAINDRDELIRQGHIAEAELSRNVTEWEEQFQREVAARQLVERRFSEHAAEHHAATAAFETTLEALQLETASLREQLASVNSELETAASARSQFEQLADAAEQNYQEAVADIQQMSEAADSEREESAANIRSLENQLADANKRLAEAAADQQQLRAELTDEKHERRKTTIALDESLAANERVERRVHDLETELAAGNRQLAQGQHDSEAVNERIERLQIEVAKARMDLAESYEQLGVARLRLANADRERDHALQRESAALRQANELSDEVKSLRDSVQREAAARRKAEAVHKREAGNNEASALFEAEQKIERLSHELAASKSVEAAYQQKAVRKVQQVKQELAALRLRLAEFERCRDDR
ncbi:MAG: hypothetical protein O3C40_37015 [Planctomycetota bacterium]|nr:hypothetical protein [Planctomycetota bacterium]